MEIGGREVGFVQPLQNDLIVLMTRIDEIDDNVSAVMCIGNVRAREKICLGQTAR